MSPPRDGAASDSSRDAEQSRDPDQAAPLTLGQLAALAILYEATAPKPGNVYRGADFSDMTFDDLLAGGIAIVPAIDHAPENSLGATIHAAVAATRSLVGRNTNLGTVLLIAPLAKALSLGSVSFPGWLGAERSTAPGVPTSQCTEDTASSGASQFLAAWQTATQRVLDALTPADTALTYAAIRLAHPGGMGTARQHDLHAPPPESLQMAMQAAAERDLVAAQYANGFQQVFQFVVPKLREALRHWRRNDAIVRVFLELLAEFPDSLIARKCGAEIARQAADRAAQTLAAGTPGDTAYHQALGDLDFWLRSDGHRRNPGTSADFIAAGLFCVQVLRAPEQAAR